MIGETIGNFVIVAQLGTGGMGDVFLAEQVQIRTKSAIKMLHANISSDRSQIDRFFNEARAVSMIKHAGTVKISDLGFTQTGRAYLVMEFLEGETLSSRIQRSGRLPLGEVGDIGRQIASVLAATHAEGIVHRDLKPDNVYLVRDAEMPRGERVKILDFGIAKLANTNMTGSANSMGTPTYMAPEQWNHSGKVDWRADVYSLGCLAFEMVAGRPPFVATSIGEACAMHLTQAPPHLQDFVPDAPPALDQLLQRMLAKSPDDRPTSMAEIAAGFSAYADTPTGSLYAVPVATTGQQGHYPTGRGVSGTVPGTAVGANLATQPTGLALASQPGQTGPGQLATQPPAHKKSHGALLALAGLVVGGGAAVAIVLGVKSGHHKPAPDKPIAAAPQDAAIGSARSPADAAVVVATPVDAGPPVPGMPNPFVQVAAPARPVLLGVDRDDAPAEERGFRPGRKVFAPAAPFTIQAHEVTYSELEPYLQETGQTIVFPEWATDPAKRAHLPATNVTWQLAHEYCASIGAQLPSDEEFEWAARGADRRPYSWGSDRLDRALTHTFVGEKGAPGEVMKSEQDKTPPTPDNHHIFDLTGNVQEWTEGLWRDDTPSKKPEDEAWVEDGETSYRALRGLPLHGDPKAKVPAIATAYREPACATGACNGKLVPDLDSIGFRCVKSGKPVAPVPHPHGPTLDAGVPAPHPVDAAVAPPGDCTLDDCQANAMEGECCKRLFPRKHPPPRPAELPDAPTAEQIDQLFDALVPGVRDCAQQTNAPGGGRRVTLSITPEGHVAVSVTNGVNPKFVSCVQKAGAALKAPASKKGATVSRGIKINVGPTRPVHPGLGGM